jgi:hypothetical protein
MNSKFENEDEIVFVNCWKKYFEFTVLFLHFDARSQLLDLFPVLDTEITERKGEFETVGDVFIPDFVLVYAVDV